MDEILKLNIQNAALFDILAVRSLVLLFASSKRKPFNVNNAEEMIDYHGDDSNIFTAPFNNMADSKIQSSTDKCVFHSQLPITAELAVIKSLSTVHTAKQRSAVIGSWVKTPSI